MDCRDALEMICNLEADGDEKAAFTLCSGFLTRQILQEDSYCAWQVTNVTNAGIINVELGNDIRICSSYDKYTILPKVLAPPSNEQV